MAPLASFVYTDPCYLRTKPAFYTETGSMEVVARFAAAAARPSTSAIDVDGNGVVNAQEIAAALNATAMRSEHLALSQDALEQAMDDYARATCPTAMPT